MANGTNTRPPAYAAGLQSGARIPMGKVVDGVTEAVNTCYATYQQQMEVVGIPAEVVRQFQLACGPLILESGLGAYPSD
ncbi:MAG: hypothetical protein OTJ97_07275 [SAR202 cluster bacterium]|nr:hypothetical protein [SAR202 cluster bacterium]